ncbi:MAG: CsbD family protein, partial [Massilia sp.]
EVDVSFMTRCYQWGRWTVARMAMCVRSLSHTDAGATMVSNFERKENTMNSDQINGKLQDLGGKIQEEAGKIVGSPEQQVKGLQNQVEGKTQEKLGDLKEKIHDATK